MSKKRLLTILLVAALTLSLLAMTAIVVDGLTDRIGPVDLGIVLGTLVEEEGRPSARLQARLDRTAALYRRGLFDTIYVSGATNPSGHNEAWVMAAYLRDQGIAPEAVVIDPRGEDTYHTAQNAARYMRERGLESAMVITQHFHITRARLALTRFGVAPVYSAHAQIWQWRDIYATAREVAALAYYLMRGYR